MAPLCSRRAIAAAIVALALAACSSGASTSQATTGSADVDAIIRRIDGVSKATFTATYHLTRKLGNVTADARVSQAPPRRAIVVRNVKFIEGDISQTCDLTTKTCTDGIAAQRIADVSAGIGFYGPTAAIQIAVSLGRSSGKPAIDTRTLAGRPATCVAINVGGGTETYCVLDTGVVALIDRADVEVDLVTYSAESDPVTLALAA